MEKSACISDRRRHQISSSNSQELLHLRNRYIPISPILQSLQNSLFCHWHYYFVWVDCLLCFFLRKRRRRRRRSSGTFYPLATYLLLLFQPFFFVLPFAHCMLRSSPHFCSSFACFQEFLATVLCFLFSLLLLFGGYCISSWIYGLWVGNKESLLG